MMHLHYRNVNDAFANLVAGIHYGSIPTRRESSRAGDVLRIAEPVTITYARPTERVLFNEGRDCNPFFHLVESMWMLAGSNEVEPVAYFNPRMREFSDNGYEFHGAYGHRWREWFGYDQLDYIIQELSAKPNSRRCVLQIWDACNCNNLCLANKLGTDPAMVVSGGKDIPCNTQAYFALGDGALDMTVCNRSNDLVWGALGANVVHFSYLQEYLACCIGCDVGKYHQITNNLHVYTERWRPLTWIRGNDPLFVEPCEVPLVTDRHRFDEEVIRLVEDMDAEVEEPYLRYVVVPMCHAFRCHKQRDYDQARRIVKHVADKQWRLAGESWICRREENWRMKHANVYTARELRRTRQASSDQA